MTLHKRPKNTKHIVSKIDINHIVRLPDANVMLQVTVRNLGCVKFLQLTSCVEIMLSLLVIILNILFIFYGMNSGWYYFVDSLGTELEVISFREGIIKKLPV